MAQRDNSRSPVPPFWRIQPAPHNNPSSAGELLQAAICRKIAPALVDRKPLARLWLRPATIFLMPEELLRYRSEFPILDRTTYLISNSLGAMPRGVEDSLHQYTELWNTRGVRAWEDEWWMLALQVGDPSARCLTLPRLGRVSAECHQLPGHGGLVPRFQRPPQ